MSLRERLRNRRMALQITRKASRLLGVRSGVFLRKLQSEDADAQMAYVMATEEVGAAEGMDIDPEWLQQILQIILDFIAMLAEIFDW